MHVLIVSQYFWPENFRINDIAVSLIKEGHKVTVITGIPNYPDGKFFKGYGFFKNLTESYNGINIIRIPLIPRGNGNGFRLILNYISFMAFACLIAPFLKIPKYDIVFGYEPSPVTVALPAILLKKIHKIPFVFYVLDLWPESVSAVGAVKSKTILNTIKLLVNYIYKNCDKILVPSRGFISNIKSYGIDDQNIIYWPQWAEEIFNSKNYDNYDIEKLPDGFKIFFAGNIGAAQGLDIIINAAKLLRGYKKIYWIIIGDGRMKPWLEEQIDKYNLNENIILLGRKPIEMMPNYFLAADSLFLSLKSDPIFSLTLPAKIQTYLACGKPIIAAIDGEAANVIADSKSGLSCGANDPDKLAEIVIQLYQMSEDDRITMGRNGFEYYEKHFKSDLLLKKLINIFNDLLKS
jgi:colanic acid biosynthesis glycosyl transferase WcaI